MTDPAWCNGVVQSNARTNRIADRVSLIGIAVFGAGLIFQMVFG